MCGVEKMCYSLIFPPDTHYDVNRLAYKSAIVNEAGGARSLSHFISILEVFVLSLRDHFNS